MARINKIKLVTVILILLSSLLFAQGDSSLYDEDQETLTLMLGQEISKEAIQDLPDGTVITLEGATIEIDGGKVLGFGTYTTGDPPELSGGEVNLNSDSVTNLNFKNSQVKTSEGLTLTGAGSIQDGIIYLEDSQVNYGSFSDRVQNAEVRMEDGELRLDQIDINTGFIIGGENDYVVIRNAMVILSSSSGQEGEFNQLILVDSPLGEYIMMEQDEFEGGGKIDEEEEEVVISEQWYGSDGPDLTVEINGNPSIAIVGWSKEVNVKEEGFNYKFDGELVLDKGNRFLRLVKNFDQNKGLINGIYVYSDAKEDIPINFNQRGDKGISFLQDSLVLSCDTCVFPFTNEPDNDISSLSMINPGESPYRLIFDFSGEGTGKVEISKSEVEIKISGNVDVINGPNKIVYEDHNGETSFDFQRIGCTDEDVACGEVGSVMIDGGIVDVVGSYASMGDTVGQFPLKHGMGKPFENEESVKNLDEIKNLELEKSGLYVISYNGFFGDLLCPDGTCSGHVAIMYYANDHWRVAEAVGETGSGKMEDNKFKDSTFSTRGVDGIYRVWSEDKHLEAPMTLKAIHAIDGLLGAKYNLITQNCVDLCVSAVRGAIPPKYVKELEEVGDYQVSFINSKDNKFVAHVVSEFRMMPETFLNDPRLEEIYDRVK